jgi:hypothetical protein
MWKNQGIIWLYALSEIIIANNIECLWYVVHLIFKQFSDVNTIIIFNLQMNQTVREVP